MDRHQRFQPRQKKQPLSAWTSTELPLHASVGVYARQSTQMQVRYATNSTEMQTVDLVDFARRLGWEDDKIIVFTQDLGVSGRLRIDEREGLRTLVSHIEDGTMKAVIVFLEDRLFRDETQIQVNTFISICRQHDVLVITPNMTYNFNNRFHIKEFRWKCEAAADYITDYVMARLVGGKHKVSERGEYDGRALPAGYILDRHEWISAAGTQIKNKGYKRYIIYKPHADVVIWLFNRYLELSGNLSQLCRELISMAVLFPSFTADVDPRNVSRFELKKVDGGYHITKRGLISILTNVSYIGWWMHQGEVKFKDNHPAIVKEDVFWYAFNRLSDYTIDGEKSERGKNAARYYHNGAVARLSLLKNIIGTELLGPVYIIGNAKYPDRLSYGLYEKDLGLSTPFHTSILVSDLDSVYVQKLQEHLKKTSNFSHYQKYASEEKQKAEHELISIQSQLNEIDQQCAGLMVSLKKPTLPEELREIFEREYSDLQKSRSVLMEKLKLPIMSDKGRELLAYSDLIEKMVPHWDNLLFSDRKMLIEALTENVLVDFMAPHWLRIIINWRDPSWKYDVGLIWRVVGSSPPWTNAENDLLRSVYTNDDRASILEKHAQRSWRAINYQAHILKVSRSKQSKNNSPIPPTITYSDWCFMDSKGIAYDEKWGRTHVLWLEFD